MIAHAEAWIAAWNRRDIEWISSHFTSDATFISPRALDLTGAATVVGRREIDNYWRTALARIRSLSFELIDVICDVESQALVVHYIGSRDGARTRGAELMRFDDGRQVFGEALYGSPA